VKLDFSGVLLRFFEPVFTRLFGWLFSYSIFGFVRWKCWLPEFEAIPSNFL
jgi:hypothetical protein